MEHNLSWEANIPLLQRLIDENRIPIDDKIALQALGVILGDIFVNAHRKLNWQVYEDELGKSHAVCIDGSQHCLFPITMVSRRLEGGAEANVDRIYQKGFDALSPHLPRLPYSD